MGTNYYMERTVKPACECCGRGPDVERLHIGKSSAGWCFSLHVEPEQGINDLPDWEVRWSQPGARILDEYGQDVTIEEMRANITERGREGRNWEARPYGYASWAEFHIRNYSEPGPRGLLRHSLDPDRRHCIGHGAGTWDLILGDFS